MKDTYVFPAIFHVADDGISIRFPDLPGCLPCAENFEQAFVRAKEALQLHLYGMEEDSEQIPEPSPVRKITLDTDEIITVIEVWMPSFREKMLNQSAIKTVRIPRWLDTLAKKERINYSHFLQKSLKNYLGVTK